MTDALAASLDRLQATVSAGIEDRKPRRREAWDRVRTEAPEHAGLITVLSKTFGKPERVVVMVNGDIIMDSKSL